MLQSLQLNLFKIISNNILKYAYLSHVMLGLSRLFLVCVKFLTSARSERVNGVRLSEALPGSLYRANFYSRSLARSVVSRVKDSLAIDCLSVLAFSKDIVVSNHIVQIECFSNLFPLFFESHGLSIVLVKICRHVNK